MDKISDILKSWYTRVCLVVWYLLACLRCRVIPWNYFGLNSRYYNREKGIFSKLEMDAVIPERHLLNQYYYDPDKIPARYPVFLKPEWGQNSNGIVRVYTKKEYKAFRNVSSGAKLPFIVQEAAVKKTEFEIYYLRSPDNRNNAAFLSITEVIDTGKTPYPINSIHNPCTCYRDITDTFSGPELEVIWDYLRRIGNFRMARVGLKADSRNGIITEDFQIVEINLFLPMPLVLLSDNVGLIKKQRIMQQTMCIAARLARDIPGKESGRHIFFQKILPHPMTAEQEVIH